MLTYDFGPNHPLRPQRVSRTIRLLEELGPQKFIDPGLGEVSDVLRIHEETYVRLVRYFSRSDLNGVREIIECYAEIGIGTTDVPDFDGMHEASLAYVAGSVAAAQAVNEGAKLAFNLSGGLHHARREQAAGFCIYNDCAIALHVLRERFDRAAYVDIDVHHGEGVQWAWLDDPSVLTCSIHQDGRTLFPGYGAVEETGAHFTSLNVPLAPRTTGDVWISAFERGILPALEAFQPQAIVLQMGADSHFADPLANIQNTVQDYLQAVRSIQALNIPIVALGGGGYNLKTVPRMWAAACLTLAQIPFEDRVPGSQVEKLGTSTYTDPNPPGPAGTGAKQADQVIAWLTENHHPNIPRP